MSKKRTKSPANNVAGNNKWETNITSADLNEGGWSYSLSLLVEDVVEDRETIDYIHKGMLSGLRRKFSILSKERLTELIMEYGNSKTKKGKDAPLNFEVCEAAKVYLDKGEKIPGNILAKVIKWTMLTAKADDAKIKEDTGKKADGKGPKSKKGPEKPDTSKSSAGKKGPQGTGKRSPEPASIKGESKLRKRGDPDPDIRFIDDEPDDGSSRYFVVTGMKDPEVIEALAEVGCIVTSIIKISRDIHIHGKDNEENEELEEKSSSTSEKNEESQTERDKDREMLRLFWTDIPRVLNTNKLLFNTPVVTLVAKHLMFSIDDQDLDQHEKCSMDLFETVAVSMYDLLDLRRQWRNYLERSKIIELPMKYLEETKSEGAGMESGRDEKAPSEDLQVKMESTTSITFENVDMDYYKYLLEEVPLENCSVYLQMSAMLEQVEITSGEKTVDWNKPQLSNQTDLSEEAAAILNGMVGKIYLPKEDLNELRKTLQINTVPNCDKESREKEVPIHALDGISLRDLEMDSSHLGKEGSMIRELRMLITSFQHIDLLSTVQVQDSIMRKRITRLQEFMKYVDNTQLSKIEINYAIKLFILENMVLSGTDENGIIRVNDEDGVSSKNINQMWDDPFMILDEVGQSIIDEEHVVRETKVEMYEEFSDTVREDSSMSEKVSGRSLDGILRTSRSPCHSPSRVKSSRRKSSVHFMEIEKDKMSGNISEGQLDVTGMLSEEQDECLQTILLDYLSKVRKRSFTEWCFEEFYEPHVMLQIIHLAMYRLPFLDIYNERKSDGKIVILHNPCKENLRLNHQPWNQWLHSNVGFRNYLDFISDKIKDWTRDEEAIYQAQLLNKELQNSDKVKEAESPKETPKKAAEKGKKGKPSPNRSRSASRSSSADESDQKEISFILPGSLKAQKMEQDKILKAKEEEERKKEEKRLLSARLKLEKEAMKDKPKRPNSKASNKSKSKKSVVDDSQDQIQNVLDEPPLNGEPEPYWPFVGYDLGDDLAHFSGEVAHLFPTDGCTIRVHRTEKLLDSISVRVSIITTQSHVFSLHILDPSFDSDQEVDNFQKVLDTFHNPGSISRYGSSTCVFNDGICLGASNYGYSGSSDKNKGILVKEQLKESGDDRSNRSEANSGDMKGTSLHETIMMDTNRASFSGMNLMRDNVDLRDNQNIIFTSPNGIQIRVGYETDENNPSRKLLLLLTKNDIQSTKSHKKEKLEMCKEIGRYITCDGRVISLLNNESIKVMFPDGTVASTSLHFETTITHEVESEEIKMEKTNLRDTPNQKKKKQPKVPSVDQIVAVETIAPEENKGTINKTRTWTITRPNGEVYESKANLNMFDVTESLTKTPLKTIDENVISSEEQCLSISLESVPDWKKYIQNPNQKNSLHISCATDPATGETLVTRSDGTLLLTTEESGIFLSEHSDHTRFTKYFIVEKSTQVKQDGEEMEDSKITEIIQIESRDYPMVTIDRTNGKIETRCGSMGSLLSVSDGSHLYKHSDGTEIEYRPDGEIIFTAAGNSQMSYLQPYGSSSYVLNTMSNIICEMLDSDGTEFIVDASGSYQVKRVEKESTKNDQSDENNNEESLKPTSAISGTSIIDGNQQEEEVRKFDQHAPRIFFLNPDGSGSELLRYRDIVDTIVNAEVDKNAFQYKESLQDHPQITGHTILHNEKKAKPWMYDYTRKTVLPKGLTCRDMKTFPNKEEMKRGLPFAMGIGKGLLIKNHPMEMETCKSNPFKEFNSKDCLLFRQFYHYPLITDEVRNNFVTELVEYNKYILRQRQKYKDLEVFDDRSQKEQNAAQETYLKYNNIKKLNEQILENAIDAVSSAPSPKVVPTCESNNVHSMKSSGKKLAILLEKERIEREKECENKRALKEKIVPNYFTSVYGKDFLMNQAVDLKTLNKFMKLFPVSREATARNDELSAEELEEMMESVVYSSDTELQKPSDTAKTNELSNINTKKEKQAIVFKKKEKKYLYYDSSLIIPNIPKRIPVSCNLPLPRYLYSERPSVEKNIKEAMVEDPVRRKHFTCSLIGGPPIGQVFQRQCRGLNVLPSRIDAGLLKEGGRYMFKIKIINTGPETGFFKIKQPPSSSGIWTEFLPGPIAAGLSREIIVHIYAIAKDVQTNPSHVYLINEPLKIITNTDILEIPISGRVMTAEKYELTYTSKKGTGGAFSGIGDSLPAIRNDNNNMVSVDLSQA